MKKTWKCAAAVRMWSRFPDMSHVSWVWVFVSKGRFQTDFGAKCCYMVLKKYSIPTGISMDSNTSENAIPCTYILLQSSILPINLTSKNFNADSKVTFFVISTFVNMFLHINQNYLTKWRPSTIIFKINFHNCMDKAGLYWAQSLW